MPLHRHQVIARRWGESYVGLAAFSHKDLFGVHAVLLVSSMVRDIAQNHEAVGSELRCLQDPSYAARRDAIPCPYTWNRLRRWNSTADVRLNIDPFKQPNDDGVSVIDVTDPAKPAVCFLNLGTGKARVSSLGPGRPISPEEYIRAYYPEEMYAEDMLDRAKYAQYKTVELGISELPSDRFPLVRRVVLDTLWPRSIFDKNEEVSGKGKAAADEHLPGIPIRRDILGDSLKRAEQTSSEFASIVEKQRMDSGEEDGQLDIPDNLVEALIDAIAEELKPKGGGETAFLDLSACRLAPKCVHDIIQGITSITRLDLSRSAQLSPESIVELLVLFPHLQTVFLFHMPQLQGNGELEEAIEQLEGRTIIETDLELKKVVDSGGQVKKDGAPSRRATGDIVIESPSVAKDSAKASAMEVIKALRKASLGTSA